MSTHVDISFSGIIGSRSHWANPFSYTSDDVELRERYSLTTGQKVLAVALAILLFVPTFGVGSFFSIYVITAAMKSRNISLVNFYYRLPVEERSHYKFSSGFFPRCVDIRRRPVARK